MELTKFTLKNHKRNLNFMGQMLINEYADSETASGYYSGETGISYRIKLFKTDKDNFVINYKRITQWQGCENEHEIFVGKNLNELCEKIPTSRCKRWFMQEINNQNLIPSEDV